VLEASLQISPTEVAKDFWQTTLLDPDQSLVRKPLHQRNGDGNHAANPGQRES
jgi:hypothetical protein